jgi:hypothetical protein
MAGRVAAGVLLIGLIAARREVTNVLLNQLTALTP